MRNFLSTFLLLVLITTNAEAQTTSATGAADSTTQSSLTPNQQAVGAAPAGSIVTDLPAPKRNNSLKFALATSSFANVKAMNTGGNQPVTTINQIRADYKKDAFNSFRINQIFSSEWGRNAAASNSFVVGDLYLQYARAHLAELPAGISANGNFRLYAPLSKATRSRGQIGSLRADFDLGKVVSPFFDWAIHIIPWASYQNTSSYSSVAADGSLAYKANSAFNLAYYLATNFNFTKRISLTHEMGLMRYWFKADETRNISSRVREFLYLDTSLNYTVNSTFGVGVGLSSYLNRDMLDQKNAFVPYRPEETDYYMTASASF